MDKFIYCINLNERGYFFAHVENEKGKEVFRIPSHESLVDIIDLGFMRHRKDTVGLTEYLRDLGCIPLDSEVVEA